MKPKSSLRRFFPLSAIVLAGALAPHAATATPYTNLANEKTRRVILAAIATVIVLMLFAGTSRAATTIGNWTIPSGTTAWSTDQNVTYQLTINPGGTLNHTTGTINTATATWNTIIGQGGSGLGTAYYNMSGTAIFLESTARPFLLGNYNGGSWQNNGIWSLTDDTAATVGTLSFGNGGTVNVGNQLHLAGDATFNAQSLSNLTGLNEYINFASGSTAQLTVANLSLANYQAYAAGGFIRIDNAVQSDFSNFQVSGNTLSVIPEPATLSMVGIVGIAMLLRRRIVRG